MKQPILRYKERKHFKLNLNMTDEKESIIIIFKGTPHTTNLHTQTISSHSRKTLKTFKVSETKD